MLEQKLADETLIPKLLQTGTGCVMREKEPARRVVLCEHLLAQDVTSQDLSPSSDKQSEWQNGRESVKWRHLFCPAPKSSAVFPAVRAAATLFSAGLICVPA